MSYCFAPQSRAHLPKNASLPEPRSVFILFKYTGIATVFDSTNATLQPVNVYLVMVSAKDTRNAPFSFEAWSTNPGLQIGSLVRLSEKKTTIYQNAPFRTLVDACSYGAYDGSVTAMPEIIIPGKLSTR